MPTAKGRHLEFKLTGVQEIDNFLDFIAAADRHASHTSNWTQPFSPTREESFKDWIQLTANEIVKLLPEDQDTSDGIALSTFLEATILVFEPTGSAKVDKLLATVSSAEINSQNTEHWATEYAEWTTDCQRKSDLTYMNVIQREANLLAAEIGISPSQKENEEAKKRLGKTMIGAHIRAIDGTRTIIHSLMNDYAWQMEPEALQAAEHFEAAAKMLREAVAAEENEGLQ